MSHFTVLVTGDNWEEQLTPYQENNMGDCPEPHLEFIDLTDEFRQNYETGLQRMIRLNDGELVWHLDDRFKNPDWKLLSGADVPRYVYPENSEKVEVPHQKMYASFKEFAADWEGYDKPCIVDGEERYGYWENPGAKWDWYKLGGRWTGFFKLKATADEQAIMTGEPGIMTEQAPPETADSALKHDIDFDAMTGAAAQAAAQKFDAMIELVGGAGNIPSFKRLRERYDDIEEARRAYRSIPTVKTLQEASLHPFMEDVAEHYCDGDRDKYIRRRSLEVVTPFAILHDGDWIERGEMGWFGHVSDEKEFEDWGEQAWRLIESLPDDTRLSIVDCHI